MYFFINEPKIIYLDLIIIYLCGLNCWPKLENQNQIREPLIETESETHHRILSVCLFLFPSGENKVWS